MSGPQSHDDDLLAALAEAMREVGGPPTAHERAVAQPARDLIGANDPWDLAELAADSLLDTPDQVRGAALASARQLTFYADEMTVLVEVTAELLVCRVPAAPEPLEVTLVTPLETRHRLQLVGDGYELLDPPTGTVRLELRTAVSAVATAWFRL